MKNPPTQKPAQSDYIQSAVRLPRQLHSEIQDAAARNGRSMNAEIIARLQAGPVVELLAGLARDVAEIKTMDREILDAVGGR